MHNVMTIDEVATYLQLGRRSVYRLLKQGDLPGRKVLGRWRFHVQDVDAWVRRGASDGGTAGVETSGAGRERAK